MSGTQKIAVFQQNNSGEKKIQGIKKYGKGLISIEIISIDSPLPSLIENARSYLPSLIQADLVIDFLKHPDISLDLALLCREKDIPVIASGKRSVIDGVITPPT